ncbi:MAG TPA: SBBP repeat-containing protein [Candidatus Acidoferrales bacterium]|nr:SBBP repeat-containing protein [Candidatus Acidoferrales bacterium]
MKLVGADPTAPISGLDELPGKSNYFVGNDRKKWRTNISNYAKVKYTGVFPGVDLVYYGSQRQLEYDFLVAPDADPSPIQFSLAGVRKPVNKHRKGPVEIAVNGDLIVKMDGGEVQFHKPVAYQESGSGIRHFVEARYILGGGQQVSLAVGSYDRRRPLVIDPVLSYSTYLGPSGGVSSIAVDTSGNAYVTGGNTGTGFPTTPGAFQTTCPGGCFPAGAAFVSKLNATGSALVYSTYLDGSNGGGAFGEDIAVDSGGDAYVTGQTGSANFPITTGAFQTVCHACFGGNGSYQTGFVTKLNSTGSALLYSTFLGGSTREIAFGIALDPSDNAYTTGETWSSDFPVTAGSFQPIYQTGGDAFVTELNSAGSALIYSTYLGGANSEGVRIKVNSAGNAYAVGGTQSPSFPTTPGAFAPTCNKCGPGTDPGGHPLQDVFVTEFSTNGSALVYSTFLGGSDGDFPGGIALDSSGNVYVTGATYSNDFPVTPGAFQTACGGGSCSGELGDAFVSKLNSTGSALLYSTYLGGNSYDAGTSIAVDSSGDAYVGGLTTSLDFPVTSGAFQTQCNNCSLTNYVSDAFMSELNPSGSTLLYSTYLGGSNEDYVGGIALDANGNIYLGGGTISTDFPTTAGSYQPTATSSSVGAFVAKFAFGSTQSGSAASITPPNLDFGTVVIGAKSSSQDITLSSTGSAALSISTIGISGANSSDFSQTNNCGASVAPDTSCTITVTFSPTVTGVMAASVTISDNASNSPQSISLSGTGTDFSLSAATGSNCPSGGNCSTSATVTAGQAATYNLQVAPVSGFNGTVTLSCGDALAKSTCSVSPSSVTVNGTAASALAVTVTTTAASMLGPYSTPASRRPSGPPVLPALLVLVVALFIAESAAARNPRRRLVPALAILAMSLVWMVGCGGGSSSGGSAGTPSGTITVTGTSSGVNHSESLNLTVN